MKMEPEDTAAPMDLDDPYLSNLVDQQMDFMLTDVPLLSKPSLSFLLLLHTRFPHDPLP